jgi:signal transduction histidine kinase
MKNAVFFLKTVMPDADNVVKEYLDIIKEEIDNSESIISDLLDSARNRTPQKLPAMAGELISRSLGRCAIPEKVHVETDIPDDLPAVNVDPFQMGQVLQNLITNAVQAMHAGGALTIATQRVSSLKFKVAEEEEPSSFKLENRNSKLNPDFIEIIISDTGAGISPENMEKLYQPLFTTKARGIGLGLVVCKNLVEANGGRIEVESELGKGTTFTIILPSMGSEACHNGETADSHYR